jgi:hypothetical protein
LATPLGTTHIDLSNRPSMAGSKDSSEVSTSNIITLKWETLLAEELLLFEEHQEQLIQEAKAKFLADFKVDRNNKVVRQRATDLSSLRPTTITPNVSSTNELQSLKAYIDEQREQLQRIIGDIQNDHKRLVRALDKSTMANLPSHEVELREYTRNSSTTGCHDQSQPLYGMPIDMYLGQRQPPTHISDKFVDLRMSEPSARERGLSGPAAADPIFRSELPRPAPKPPHAMQTLDNTFGPSAYGVRQSEYNVGRSGHMAGQSAYLTGQSDTEFFEEDGYPTPYPSQLDSPSHHTIHQHHNIIYQNRESEYFLAPRRPERNGQSYVPHRACINASQNPNQWGRKQHINIQTNSPILDQRAGDLPSAAIDIVREEIAGAFRDKLGVSIVPGGSHIGDLMIASLTVSHTHTGPEYPNSQSFRVTKEKTRVNT